MLNDSRQYHGVIRKVIVAFGRLFSGIYIERRLDDSVNGETVQTLHVPIAFSNKEKWIVRIDSDPNLENNTYISLPRMAFEITGYSYDPERKLGRMNKIACAKDGTTSTTSTPVPYNLDINLYVLTKTQEDALQIIEQILPVFTPEYTLSIKAVPEMNIIQDIPFVLNSIDVQDDYDGDFQTRRFVTHTLNFTAKMNIYGSVSEAGVIGNINITAAPNRKLTIVGDIDTLTCISKEWTNT